MGFNITIVYPVPEIVDWHIVRKGQNPSNSLVLCSSFVCSLSCLEGILCSPGKEPCWIFSWTINDTFKDKSLQQLQRYCRAAACLWPKGPQVSLLLAGSQGSRPPMGRSDWDLLPGTEAQQPAGRAPWQLLPHWEHLITYILLLHGRQINGQKDRICTNQLILNQGFSILSDYLWPKVSGTGRVAFPLFQIRLHSL